MRLYPSSLHHAGVGSNASFLKFAVTNAPYAGTSVTYGLTGPSNAGAQQGSEGYKVTVATLQKTGTDSDLPPAQLDESMMKAHGPGPSCRFRQAHRRVRIALWMSLASGAALLPNAAVAQPLAGPQHAGASSFHDAVAAAWARLPQRQDLAAQGASAAARYAAGGAFLPNAPYAVGTYFNDKAVGSNYNYLTAQAEVGTPIWLPGQGRATQATARADGVAVEAAIEAAHLALAAQVLDLAAQASVAANARDVAARRLATAQSLSTNLARQFRVGEAAQSDALAASADAANTSMTLNNAEAQLAVAQAALAAVVGTPAVPRLDAPGPAPGSGPASSHPRIVAATRAVEAAQASARLTRIDIRDSPELGLQGINEKQPNSRWDTRFGVTIRFPFATEARNAPRRAAAEQAVTQAMVQLTVAQREVAASLQQAQAMLAGAERSSAVSIRAAAELDKRRGQIGRAWRVGEMPFIEVVRANALAYDAEYAREKARTDLAAARQRLRLAAGLLP